MRKLITAIALSLALLVITVSPVLAYLANPASMSIHSVKVFRNLAETNDLLVTFHYEIEYGTFPTDVSATDSIEFRIYNGTTLLSTSQPYVFASFETNGYGDGVSSFYFGNTTAPAWGGLYDINIMGKAAYFDPIQTETYTLTAADYTSAVTQEDNREAVYNYVIYLCDTFKTIYADISLKSTTDTAMVLSTGYGEPYFRNAIPGLQSLCPGLFLVQLYVPEEIEVVPYDMTQEDIYTARLDGTDIMRGAERAGVVFGGISGAFFLGLIVFACCIGICIWTMRQGWGLEPGMIASIALVILGATLIGSTMFTLTMILGLLGGMAIMFIFGYKRA